MKYLLVVIGSLVAIPHLSFAQSNSNATPPRQIYNSTDPIDINVPYRSPQPTSPSAPTSADYGTVNSVQHYHTYWRTQQSASQRGSGSYANEPVTLRPLLQKLDKYNRTWGTVSEDSPHHPMRTGQVQVKWMLEKQISDERNRLETEKKARNKHLRDVVNQTDAFLNQAFLQSGDIKIAVRVQYALKLATEKREGNSLDLVTRDAVYYLHGLYASLSGDIEHIAFTAAASLYDDLKALDIKWINDIIKVDEENTLSPPGGAPWAYMGLKDGYKLRHLSTNEVGPGEHGLSTSLFLN